MEGSFSELAGRYNAVDGSLGQVVRRRLISRALDTHLPHPQASVLDVGGGAGQQSIPLARKGHDVTILDPSPEMLAEARRRLTRERDEVYRRVRFVEGPGERAPEVLGEEAFDAVLCHGVVMYLEDPSPLVLALSGAARPGGVVSVLAKNAAALAVRPALQGRYGEALALLDADRAAGRLGVVTRGDTVVGLSRTFEEAGLGVERWYGVRVFTDHLGGGEPGPGLPDILELEWEAGRTDPYRSVARLIHLVGRKR
ncbi:MAG: class I SAM-dependent methyltransferase [Rubrobacter sp.]